MDVSIETKTNVHIPRVDHKICGDLRSIVFKKVRANMSQNDLKSSVDLSSSEVQSNSSVDSVLSNQNLSPQKSPEKVERLLHERSQKQSDQKFCTEEAKDPSNLSRISNTETDLERIGIGDVCKTGSNPSQLKKFHFLKRNIAPEVTTPIEKALLEMAPRKAKRMFDRRKRARERGEDEAAVLWDNQAPSKGKPHSLKQIQRLSNELDQVLGVLCNGDKSVAADVLSHLMTKRHMGSDLFQSVERNKNNMTQRTLDNRIVDGISGFFSYHHSMGTRPTEAAHAVDAVMVACCWDICEDEERLNARKDSPSKKRKIHISPEEKKVSNSSLIDRLGVNRGALKRARTKARTIKTDGKTHYKPEDRKPRKDKGVPARIYSEVKKIEESLGSPRQKNEYTAVDALSTIRDASAPQHLLVPQSYSPSLTFPHQNSSLASYSQNRQLAQMLYRNPLDVATFSADAPFILPRTSQLHEVRNAIYGRQGPGPSRALESNLPYNYNQYLQLNTPSLQPSLLGVNITPENAQGKLNHVQANILKDLEEQKRKLGQDPYSRRGFPSDKEGH